MNRKNNKTILLTTHYIEEAEKLCEKVAIIDLNPIENFKVGEFSAENPLKASIYSIDVNKKSGN